MTKSQEEEELDIDQRIKNLGVYRDNADMSESEWSVDIEKSDTGDTYRNEIKQLIADSNKALLEKVREIIGKDETLGGIYELSGPEYGARCIRNKLRAEVHTLLDKLEPNKQGEKLHEKS